MKRAFLIDKRTYYLFSSCWLPFCLFACFAYCVFVWKIVILTEKISDHTKCMYLILAFAHVYSAIKFRKCDAVKVVKLVALKSTHFRRTKKNVGGARLTNEMWKKNIILSMSIFGQAFITGDCLTLSWRRSLSYRNQSIDLLCNSWKSR